MCVQAVKHSMLRHMLKEHGQMTLKTLSYHFSLLEIWYIILAVFFKQGGMLPPPINEPVLEILNTVTEIM